MQGSLLRGGRGGGSGGRRSSRLGRGGFWSPLHRRLLVKWVFLNAAPLFGTICSDTERESRPCWQEQLAGRAWGSRPAFTPQGVA